MGRAVASTEDAIGQDDTEIAIIGGGVCGVICAGRCTELNIPYTIIERQDCYGGVWSNLANANSALQCPEIMYRWHRDYPLGAALSKVSGARVLERLREFAADRGMPRHTRLSTEVETMQGAPSGDGFVLTLRDVRTGRASRLRAKFVMVTHGILAGQYTLAERGLDPGGAFAGTLSLAGREGGRDCAVSREDLTGKDAVILGSGAFACEAMEAAVANNAASVTLVARERRRWLLPFSRELSMGGISQMPLLPWSWKMALMRAWLAAGFFRPAGLEHMMPSGDASDMDYAGQSNDAFFRLAKAGRVTHLVDGVAAFEARHVRLVSGRRLPADVVIAALGLRFQASPAFLAGLGIGFKDLHSFAFLGASGRIGTAQDGIFAYVPAGPHKQFDMFLHAYAAYKAGRIKEVRAALEPTPIPQTSYDTLGGGGHRSAWSTWFEVAHPLAPFNRAMEWRERCYFRVLAVGRGPLGRAALYARIQAQALGLWLALLGLGCWERWHTPRPL